LCSNIDSLTGSQKSKLFKDLMIKITNLRFGYQSCCIIERTPAGRKEESNTFRADLKSKIKRKENKTAEG
jgi:hypothetical protein